MSDRIEEIRKRRIGKQPRYTPKTWEEDAIDDLLAEISRLLVAEARLNHAEREIDEWARDFNGMQDTATRLQAALAEKEQIIQAWKDAAYVFDDQKKHEYEQQIADLKRELAEEEEDHDICEAKLKREYDKEITNHIRTINTLIENMDTPQDLIGSHIQQITELNSQVERLRQQMSEDAIQYANLAEKLKKTEIENHDLRGEVINLQEHFNIITAKLEEKEKSREQWQKMYQEKVIRVGELEAKKAAEKEKST